MTTNDPERKNQKLGRTIQELESALSAWETLSDIATAQAPTPAVTVTSDERELRKKTRELLSEIRAQLTDLDS